MQIKGCFPDVAEDAQQDGNWGGGSAYDQWVAMRLAMWCMPRLRTQDLA